MSWDRSKQTYWISRRDNSVRDMEGRFVCDLPPHFDIYGPSMEKICFAKDPNEINSILGESSERTPEL